MRRIAHALTIVLLCSGGATAADPTPAASAQPPQSTDSAAPAEKPSDDNRLDNLQKPEGETPKADESWWQKVLRAAPNCKSFTDGCRTCSQTVCSNIGIACQPKEWACNDAKQDTSPDAKQPDKQPATKP
jgi:hypothetical protein